MKAIFVAGTDTEAGKTTVAGLLARYLSEKGYRVVTQKWVQTGSAKVSHDTDTHLRLMKKNSKEYKKFRGLMSPYLLKLPSSPHLASRLEGKTIDTCIIERAMKKLGKYFDVVIVEGTGGLLVPFSGKKLFIDTVMEFRLPILLIAKNKLGAINHTLLSVEALKSRHMKIAGMVFNNTSKDEDALVLKDNPRIIKRFTDIEIFGTLPYSRNTDVLYEHFIPLGNRIADRL